jgi:hypothetical protein
MNSFIGISKQHTTNLAVVAPGIAEALLATALGLVAAIPAVVMYNMFSRWIDAQRVAPDPRVVSHVYEAPKDCELDDRQAWFAANPALGIFKSLGDLEQESRLALAMPANEPEFRNFSLNQRVEAANPFVSRSVWEQNGGNPGDFKGRKVWGGLDLSSVHDLTALVLVDSEGGVHPIFWLPEHGLHEKSKKDLVPYDVWKKQGYLQTTPGKSIDGAPGSGLSRRFSMCTTTRPSSVTSLRLARLQCRWAPA